MSKLQYIIDRSVVEKDTGCWRWIKATNANGYGKGTYKNKSVFAHRLAFYLENDFWPEMACHNCGNNYCVNPNHIYNGNAKTNGQDQVKHGKSKPGESNNGAILTSKQVKEIVGLKTKNPKITYQKIADIYGVGRDAIKSIFNGRSWSSITGFTNTRKKYN